MATQEDPGGHHFWGCPIYILTLLHVVQIGRDAKFLLTLTYKKMATRN